MNRDRGFQDSRVQVVKVKRLSLESLTPWLLESFSVVCDARTGVQEGLVRK
jgi:hypothetical protein